MYLSVKNLFIAIIVIFLINNPMVVLSEILYDLDLLPLEINNSKLSISSNISLNKENNFNYLGTNNNYKTKNISNYSLDYLNIGNLNYTINYTSSKVLARYNTNSNKKFDNYDEFRLSLITQKIKQSNGFLEGVSYLTLTPEHEVKFNCLEFENYIIGGSNSECKKNSKNVISSNSNNLVQPAAVINNKKIGIGFGVRKVVKSWKSKTVISFSTMQDRINYNYKLGDGFNYIQPSLYNNSFPQTKNWISSTYKVALSRAINISSNWGFGVRFTGLVSKNTNFITNTKLNKNNYNHIYEAKLSRKFNSNSYLSIKSLLTTNNLIGIKNDLYSQIDGNLITEPYKEIKLTFGYIFNNESNITDQNIYISSILNIDNSKLITSDNKRPKEKKLINKNDNIKVVDSDNKRFKEKKLINNKDNLKQFALLFAEKYDVVNKRVSKNKNF